MKKPNLFHKTIEVTSTKKTFIPWYLKGAVYFFFFAWAVFGVFSFFSTHDTRTPIILQNPFPVKKTTIISPVASKSAGFIRQVFAEDLTNEQYICQKFGNHCRVAVAIAKAESGLREDAVHQNNNGTIDIGCWQINSIHLKQAGLTLAMALDCKKATDWVFDHLFQDQGFNPWYAYTSGNYLAKL